MDDKLPWQGEELDAKLFDYYEGALPPAEVAQIEAYLRSRGEPLREEAPVARLPSEAAPVPAAFADQVASTIHARSGGRFFGRASWSDRVPLGVLLACALAIALALLWWSRQGVAPPTRPTPAAIPTEIAPKP